ncbi:hypothetical protein ACFL6C_09580 [Myxococcota bacterium]
MSTEIVVCPRFSCNSPIVSRAVSFLLTFVVASPAVAGSVVVFGTAGPGGKNATRTLMQALKSGLSEHDVSPKARPRAWKKINVRMAGQIAETTSAAGADVGVASMVAKKRRKLFYVIVAVKADGTVVFDKATRLPRKRPDKKITGLGRDLARAISDELRSSEPVATATEPVDTTETTDVTGVEPEDTGGGETDAGGFSSPTALLGGSEEEEQEPKVTVKRRRRRRGALFHAAAQGGAGGLTFQDSIVTNVQGGDLSIGIGITMLITAGAEISLGNWLTFAATFRRYGARMTHKLNGDNPDTPDVVEPEITPKQINASALGTTALLGTGMEFGPLIGGIVAGLSYDSFKADTQKIITTAGSEEAALVPSWGRFAPVAGVTLSYGNLGSEGLTGQLGLLAVPWASHSEMPLTSGNSPSVLGVQSWLRVRYQIPDLFGTSGGLFVEMRADIEFLTLQFKGNGTRKAIGSGDPVQASEETRLMVGGGLGLGYLF